MNDAVAFVTKVKASCDQQTYQTFLAKLTAYNQGTITMSRLYPEVRTLLAGHNDLFRGFSAFLPARFDPAEDDQDGDSDVEVTGERTLEERNAEGFANAIAIDDDEEEEQQQAAELPMTRRSVRKRTRGDCESPA